MKLYLESLSLFHQKVLLFIARVLCVCFCLTLLGSSASSDLKLSRTLPLASACQMCSSPCCTWSDYFHSWLRQVSEECEARGMPVSVAGLDWSAGILGRGCAWRLWLLYVLYWQLRDSSLCSCPSHPSLMSYYCSPVPLPVLQLLQPLPIICGVVLKSSEVWVRRKGE